MKLSTTAFAMFCIFYSWINMNYNADPVLMGEGVALQFEQWFNGIQSIQQTMNKFAEYENNLIATFTGQTASEFFTGVYKTMVEWALQYIF
jgi:hypothetical protein